MLSSWPETSLQHTRISHSNHHSNLNSSTLWPNEALSPNSIRQFSKYTYSEKLRIIFGDKVSLALSFLALSFIHSTSLLATRLYRPKVPNHNPATLCNWSPHWFINKHPVPLTPLSFVPLQSVSAASQSYYYTHARVVTGKPFGWWEFQVSPEILV